MFIKTIKVKKPNVVAVGLLVFIICLVAVVVCIGFKLSNNKKYVMTSENERQSFFTEMGWKVSENYLECKVVVVPQEFNDVYEEYNKLQKEQGFDLEKYKGKTVEIYSYQVYNYPEHENDQSMVCSLMVYDGVLIGGDVCCNKLDGFMQGLCFPDA